MGEPIPDLAVAELDALRNDGAEPTWQEVADVIALCRRIQSPEVRLMVAKGLPVRIGGAKLWPLTIRAAAWLDAAYGAFSDPAWCGRSVAYAMAHARMAGDSAWPCTSAAVRATVRRWWRNLTATEREVVEAIRQIEAQSSDAPEAKANRRKRAVEILSRYCATTGYDPATVEGLRVDVAAQVVIAVHAAAQDAGEDMRDSDTLDAEHGLGVLLARIRARYGK